jgi:hypothetical protein
MATILSEDEDAASRGKERATLTETVVSLRPGKLVTSQVERLKASIEALAALNATAPHATLVGIGRELVGVLIAGGVDDAGEYMNERFDAHSSAVSGRTMPVPAGGTITTAEDDDDEPEGPVIKRAKMVEPTYDPDEEPFIAS